MMVATLYDEAIYYTPEEHSADTELAIDVQEVVERPHFYMFAQTADSIEDQLLYSESRRQALYRMDELVKLSTGMCRHRYFILHVFFFYTPQLGQGCQPLDLATSFSI